MEKGIYTALVTPFKSSGEVDAEKTEFFIERQIKEGVKGVVLVGTTGEAPTLSREEKDMIVERAVKKFKGRTTIIAGCGSFDTRQAVSLAKRYGDMGADFLLSVAPYYNKPDDEGMYSHFAAVADAAAAPVLLYNVPSRTGSCISLPVLGRLKAHGNVAGIKEAGGSISFLSHVCALADDDFTVLCGNDDMILPALALGASGAVSVWSNLEPAVVTRLAQAFWDGDCVTARKIQLSRLNLTDALFADTNPLPIKAALKYAGLDAGGCRLPLKSMRSENASRLFSLLDGREPV